jgi:hypothetical protein
MTTKIIPTINRLPYGAYGFEGDEPPRVVCPPRCKDAEKMHEVEVGKDGTIEVNHEVDFGEYAFGNDVQRLDGTPVDSSVTINSEDSEKVDEPAVLRRVAADLMDAADWLESVQDAKS